MAEGSTPPGIAMGSPFGLYGSVSAGVTSGLDRSFKVPRTGQTLTGLFQIDAAVNPVNSGGALVDRDGRLIGIVTALVNPTEDDVFHHPQISPRAMQWKAEPRQMPAFAPPTVAVIYAPVWPLRELVLAHTIAPSGR